MTLTTHAATGILVAYWFQDPLLGFLAAIVSHFILDMIPHGDEYIYWRLVHNLHDPLGRRLAIGDIAAMLLMIGVTLLFKDNPQNDLIIWGALGGILPDLIMSTETHFMYGVLPTAKGAKARMIESFLRLVKPHQKLHKWCHDLVRTPIRLQEGYVMQIVFIFFYITFFIH